MVTTLRQRMLEDLQIRNYAPTTIAANLRGVAGFAKHFGKPPDQLGPEHIRRQYQLFLSQQKRRVPVPLHPGRLGTPVFLHPHAAPPNRHRTHSLALVRKEAADRLEPAGSQSAAGSAQKPRPPHHAVHDVCRRTQGLRTGSPQRARYRQRPERDLDSRRQRAPGSANPTAAEAIGVAPLLLAVEAAKRLVIPRQQARTTHLPPIHLQGVNLRTIQASHATTPPKID